MITISRTSTGVEYTAALARGLADVVAYGDVIAVHGPLGAGKTTFTRALAQALGVREGLASSPTFVMVNQYPFENARLGAGQLIHVDAYRLGGVEDLESLGWDAIFDSQTRRARGRSLAIVEWADRIEEALPAAGELAMLTIRPVGEASREFEIQVPEAWRGRPKFEAFGANEPCRCPETREWVSPTGSSYPFATQQAKMADLNRWFTGGYTISRELEADDVESSGS